MILYSGQIYAPYLGKERTIINLVIFFLITGENIMILYPLNPDLLGDIFPTQKYAF